MESRHEYVEKLKQKLDEWNAKIDELEVKAKLAEMENRSKYESQLEQLKQHRDEIKEKINKMPESSEQAYRDLRKGIEGAWESLTDAYHKAKSHFKE